MKRSLRNTLIDIARKRINSKDVSHDFSHALRVLSNAEIIAKAEKADLSIVIASALFHDIVCYPKNHPKSRLSSDESAKKAVSILNKIQDFDKKKIKFVESAIKQCSFSKNIIPETLEGKILQDADLLEATGAIAIMRTFASTGATKRPFYHLKDPFCISRKPDDLKFALDLFYSRLLKAEKRMHTKTAKKIAKKRDLFLKQFLSQLKIEIGQK